MDVGWEQGFDAYLSARLATMRGNPELARELRGTLSATGGAAA